MPRLHIFNPEHDYALANGGTNYFAPASIVRLRRSLELLPLIWSDGNDYILCENDKIISVNNPSSPLSAQDIVRNIDCVEPWGWDRKIVSDLLKLGVESRILPTEDEIENLRRLSHRRISVLANEVLGSPYVPMECFTLEAAMEFARQNTGCYFKLPWSSGGRGVVATEELNQRQIEEWVKGAIRKQGSVLAETGVKRSLDFATLWNSANGEVTFEGFSVSISDGRGKYGGNLYGSQEALRNYIGKHVPRFNGGIVEKQRRFLNKEIAPYYKGKMGIDMMGDVSGNVFPFVELNLRRTMGHVAMDYYNLKEKNYREINIRNLPLIPLPH